MPVRYPLRRIVLVLLALAVALLGATLPKAAHAAPTLTRVTGFGSNPGALDMYAYRPDGLAAGAPLVVALHGCGQSASDYFGHAGWQKFADQWKFALVFPEQTTANNPLSCFNWYQTGDTARDQGEALSIKQMVDYAVGNFGLSSSRVYVTGLSAGGAMTAVMIATYPDVFAGGAVIAGLAYRCATDQSSATVCQFTAGNKTPEQWGDLVRGANPGYAGPWPRVDIWYGDGDHTVVPANAAALRDQWTNVWAISQAPSSTSTPKAGTTLEVYNDNAGQAAVKLYKVAGIGHGTPVDPGSGQDQCGTADRYYPTSVCSSYYIAKDFGLDVGMQSPTPTPTATGTPTPTPTPTPTVAPVCVTASNYAHVAAGRAYQSGGRAYAAGSNQPLGLYNVFTSHTLRQTSASTWVVADSGC